MILTREIVRPRGVERVSVEDCARMLRARKCRHVDRRCSQQGPYTRVLPQPSSAWPGSFVPSSVFSVQLLIDPSVTSSVTSSGDICSAINDLSGLGDSNKNLVQATSGDQPTYTPANGVFNGNATLDYTVPQSMTSGTWAAPLAQPCTYFFVAASSTSGGNVVAGTGTAQQAVRLEAGTNMVQLAAPTLASINVPASPATIACYAAIFNGASSTLYQNFSAAALGTVNPGTDSQTNFDMGRGTLVGSVAYILAVTGIPSTTNISKMFAYLGARFGHNWF
jgi:hypothetical protein